MTNIQMILIVLGAFLIGSIPFSFLITKLAVNKDIRTMGSGNPGATNVYRSLNFKYGLAVLFLDMSKGFFPVLWATKVSPNSLLVPAVALSLVLGHDFSPFLRFKGGKGVATSLGVFLVLNTYLTLLVLLIFIVLTISFGLISFASVIGAVSFPILAYVLKMDDYIYLAIVLAVLIVVKHHSNLKRLWHGKEKRI